MGLAEWIIDETFLAFLSFAEIFHSGTFSNAKKMQSKLFLPSRPSSSKSDIFFLFSIFIFAISYEATTAESDPRQKEIFPDLRNLARVKLSQGKNTAATTPVKTVASLKSAKSNKSVGKSTVKKAARTKDEGDQQVNASEYKPVILYLRIHS